MAAQKKTTAPAAEMVAARVLMELRLEGAGKSLTFHPNDVVEAPAALFEQYPCYFDLEPEAVEAALASGGRRIVPPAASEED